MQEQVIIDQSTSTANNELESSPTHSKEDNNFSDQENNLPTRLKNSIFKSASINLIYNLYQNYRHKNVIKPLKTRPKRL